MYVKLKDAYHVNTLEHIFIKISSTFIVSIRKKTKFVVRVLLSLLYKGKSKEETQMLQSEQGECILLKM